jgi:hypothetical protein
MSGSMRKAMLIATLVALGLGVAACTNRPLSMMDTFWFDNTHPYLVQTAPATAETSGPEY